MNSKMIGGPSAERVFVSGKNAESSSTISAGQPVALVINGTDDGLAVVLPGTMSTELKAHALCYGVAAQDMSVGQTGNVQVFGFCSNVRLVRNTRAATTDVWASIPALAIGSALAIDTVNNAFSVCPAIETGARTVVTNATTDTIAANFNLLRYYNPVVLCSSQASTTTATSATTYATGTVSTMTVKAFLRLL